MFVIALLIVLVWMMFYTELVSHADVAFTLNIIPFSFCWFRAVLTLPGIAGIVLTIGMSVDANV